MEIEDNKENITYDAEYSTVWFSIAKYFPDYLSIPFFKNENNQNITPGKICERRRKKKPMEKINFYLFLSLKKI